MNLHNRNDETFNCNICDTAFESISDFMKHRKTKHKERVKMCKNKETCVFKTSCWFLHDDYQNINENSEKKEDIVQRCEEKNASQNKY